MELRTRYQLIRGPGAASVGWRAEMSPRLRVAGEWQFGSVLVTMIAFAVRGSYSAILVFGFLSAVTSVGLSYRFAESRTSWWGAVAMFTFCWLFIGIGVLFFNNT